MCLPGEGAAEPRRKIVGETRRRLGPTVEGRSEETTLRRGWRCVPSNSRSSGGGGGSSSSGSSSRGGGGGEPQPGLGGKGGTGGGGVGDRGRRLLGPWKEAQEGQGPVGPLETAPGWTRAWGPDQEKTRTELLMVPSLSPQGCPHLCPCCSSSSNSVGAGGTKPRSSWPPLQSCRSSSSSSALSPPLWSLSGDEARGREGLRGSQSPLP